MKEILFHVLENRMLSKNIFRLRLKGDCTGIERPGQFTNLLIPDRFLRRPISVCDWDGEGLDLIYKVVGHGTAYMRELRPGETVRGLLPLGNGFDLLKAPERPVLVGGGVGVPPLYGACKRLLDMGKKPTVLLGFNTKAEVFYEDAFAALGVPVKVATVDGSHGVKGLVTELLPDASYVLSCGPEPMLRALHARVRGGQFSLEARMGCGFGACMGCSLEMKDGFKRVCKEGPVFDWEELPW